MAIKHFSHKHLLVLNEGIEKRDDNSGRKEVLCNACWRPIIKEGGSAYYSCSESDPCKFFLHKTCAELPKEIKHSLHPKHSLTLFAVPPYPYVNEESICNICCSKSRGFTYHCSVCKFDVEVKCAIEDCSFRHQSHDHNLTLLQRPATFHCDACDGVAEDLSYHCTLCPFWIHKNCASSPTTIKPTFHSHPLNLSYSIPDKYCSFMQKCNICRKIVSPSHWLYMCAGCRIFTHIKCATSEPTVLRYVELRPHIAKLMIFPLMPEQSSLDLIRQFVERLSLKAADRIEARDELHHWSHEDHPLILFKNQLQCKDKNEMKVSEKMLICDGCVKSINAEGEEDPYYACLQCNFFLHKICATSPREFHQPVQLLKPIVNILATLPREFLYNPLKSEQPLQLLKPRYDFNFIRCGKCRIATNGFYLSGSKGNDDVICAALPISIKHEGHTHPLVRTIASPGARCASCSLLIEGTKYTCEAACDFHMDSRCILLPRTIRHRWDPHPIPLVYPPIPDHPDLFYCEICEEEIDTTYWLYFCAVCDQAFHIDCLYPIDEYSNVKFGSTHKFDCHPHSLTFVRKSANEYPSPCGKCGKSRDGEPVLECGPCNFLLCPDPCAIDLISHS